MSDIDWGVLALAGAVSLAVYTVMGIYMYINRGGSGSGAGYGGMTMGFAFFAIFPAAAFSGMLALPLMFDLPSSVVGYAALIGAGLVGFGLGYIILRWIIGGLFKPCVDSV